MSILRATNFDWAYAHRKQVDIFTPVTAALLDKKLPYRSFSPARMEKVWSSDRAFFGKGDEFARNVRKLQETILFAREFEATAESLSWALSFLLGSVSTSGPTGSIYEHILTFVDPSTQKETLYTSILEKAGSEYEKLVSGVVVADLTLTAVGTEHLILALNCSARQQATSAQALPSVTVSPFFRSNFATFTFGAKGSEVSISNEVISWALNLSQNPEYRWHPGQTSGEESFFRYALIGTQAVSGNIRFFIDNARRNLFLDDTECGLTITCTAVSDFNQKLKIEIPKFIIQSEDISQDGQTTGLQLNFTEDTVMKDAGVDGSPIRITLENEIAALLV